MPDLPAFQVFYHASFWLLAVAVAFGASSGIRIPQWGEILRAVWRAGRDIRRSFGRLRQSGQPALTGPAFELERY